MNKKAALCVGKQGYIDAIDGLRAVAVLLVLFFHAGFEFAKGGFVGVDVFFVISGYLITSNIVRDQQRGDWSFSKFYSRRIARLSPALFVTVLATLFFAYFILTPDDLARLGRSGIYAALSVSNIFFWLEAGYFDQGAATKPLLHTWSLGVEEQFYLVWPVLIFFLYRWRGVGAVIVGLAAIGAASLIAAMALEEDMPNAVFFLTPFRIYQFALGGLLALGVVLTKGRARSIVGYAAIAGLVAVTVFSSGEHGSYFVNAVAPALCAAGFIWSAQTPAIKTVFASAPMMWIGQRSYSIYLVHWPLMVLWPLATDFNLSIAEGGLAIGLSVLLGAILHTCVEKPLRFKSSMQLPRRSASLAATAAMLTCSIVVGAHYWGFAGFPGRVPDEIKQIIGDNSLRWKARHKNLRMEVCNITKEAPLTAFDTKICADPPKDRRAYMVIGDSYGSDTYLVLKEAYPDIYFGQMTLPGCLIALPASTPKNLKDTWCARFLKVGIATAAERGFDGAVFVANWRPSQGPNIDRIVEWGVDNNLDVVIVTHRPMFRERIPAIVLASMSVQGANARAQASLQPGQASRARALEKRLLGETKVINIYALLCPDDCPIFDENTAPLYIDKSHISMEGVHWLAPKLRKTYPQMFSAGARQAD